MPGDDEIGRPPRDAPVLFVPDLDAPQLTDSDHHHLERVLRLRHGADITVADGRGTWRTATFGPTVTPTGRRLQEPSARPAVVGFAMLKADRTELVAQKLTELGVTTIQLLLTERAVVRWDEDSVPRKMARLQAVIREAATQSRRATLPTLHPPRPITDIAGAALAEPGGGPMSSDLHTILVGPEGGWTPAELEVVGTHVGLGVHVLRAETAAIAAGVLLTTR